MPTAIRKRSLLPAWMLLLIAAASVAGCDAFSDRSEGQAGFGPRNPGGGVGGTQFGGGVVPIAPPGSNPNPQPVPQVCPVVEPAHGSSCATTRLCAFMSIAGGCPAASFARCENGFWHVASLAPTCPADAGPPPDPDPDFDAGFDDDAGM